MFDLCCLSCGQRVRSDHKIGHQVCISPMRLQVDWAPKLLLDLASGKEPVSVGWQLVLAHYQNPEISP